MAITSIGYPTDVGKTNVDWAIMQKGLGAEYFVNSLNDARVTPVSGGTRQVSISAGVLGGCGVVDVLSAAETVTLPTVSSGTKYFLIVARRDFNPSSGDPTEVNGTSFTYIDAGTSAAALPSRNTDGQVAGGSGLDDQPLALVPLTAGSAVPGTPIDVRVLGSSARGGLLALDERALQYQSGNGQIVCIGEDYWIRRGDGWQKDKVIQVSRPGENPLGIAGAGGWATIGAPANFTQYGRRSRISGFHQVRLQACRTGADMVFSSVAGEISDSTIMFVNATEFQPPYQLVGAGSYRNGAATYSCGVVMNTDGSVGVISGAPSTVISRRTDGGWSFRANFEWMSA